MCKTNLVKKNQIASYLFSEVFRALKKTRGLYRRWSEFQNESELITKDEIEWTNTELKNSLRSIEWDLEDLEDTIDIVEKNPSKFKIDNKELTKRKHFIDSTKNEIQSMKDKINMNRGKDKDRLARQVIFLLFLKSVDTLFDNKH